MLHFFYLQKLGDPKAKPKVINETLNLSQQNDRRQSYQSISLQFPKASSRNRNKSLQKPGKTFAKYSIYSKIISGRCSARGLRDGASESSVIIGAHAQALRKSLRIFSDGSSPGSPRQFSKRASVFRFHGFNELACQAVFNARNHPGPLLSS